MFSTSPATWMSTGNDNWKINNFHISKQTFIPWYKETIFNLHGQSRDDVRVRWASWCQWLRLKPRPIWRRSKLYRREEREHRRQGGRECCREGVGSWCNDRSSCHLNLPCCRVLPFDEPHWMISSTLLQMGIWPGSFFLNFKKPLNIFLNWLPSMYGCRRMRGSCRKSFGWVSVPCHRVSEVMKLQFRSQFEVLVPHQLLLPL